MLMNFSNDLVLAAWLAFAFGQPQAVQEPATTETAAHKTEASVKSPTTSLGTLNDAEYKIGLQDVLRIDVCMGHCALPPGPAVPERRRRALV